MVFARSTIRANWFTVVSGHSFRALRGMHRGGPLRCHHRGGLRTTNCPPRHIHSWTNLCLRLGGQLRLSGHCFRGLRFIYGECTVGPLRWHHRGGLRTADLSAEHIYSLTNLCLRLGGQLRLCTVLQLVRRLRHLLCNPLPNRQRMAGAGHCRKFGTQAIECPAVAADGSFAKYK
jgi:hypothetical protein